MILSLVYMRKDTLSHVRIKKTTVTAIRNELSFHAGMGSLKLSAAPTSSIIVGSALAEAAIRMIEV